MIDFRKSRQEALAAIEKSIAYHEEKEAVNLRHGRTAGHILYDRVHERLEEARARKAELLALSEDEWQVQHEAVVAQDTALLAQRQSAHSLLWEGHISHEAFFQG